MSLMALGTVALDNIKTPKEYRVQLLGGSGSHFALSASHFTKVHLASVIGDDFPQKHLTFLKKRGINLDSIQKLSGKTFQWDGEYKAGEMNQAITHGTELGVLLTYKPEVTAAQKNIPNVFLANFDPNIQAAFLKCMKNPKFVGMDTMNLWIANMKKEVIKLAKQVHLFVLNDGEAMQLTGESNIIKAGKAIRKLGPKYVVIKKGEHGVFFFSDKFMFAFPAYPVTDVIDPTGAGDTFAGAIMGYLSKVKKINEKNLRRALLYATTLSSFNVEGFGMAKTAGLTNVKIQKRMNEFVKFIHPSK